jgi:IS5 family transposase
MGEERLGALIQESLAVATRTGGAKPADFSKSKVIIDTTVQPKAVAFPTEAKLMQRARERLVERTWERFSRKHLWERVWAIRRHQRSSNRCLHRATPESLSVGRERDPILTVPAPAVPSMKLLASRQITFALMLLSRSRT